MQINEISLDSDSLAIQKWQRTEFTNKISNLFTGRLSRWENFIGYFFLAMLNAAIVSFPYLIPEDSDSVLQNEVFLILLPLVTTLCFALLTLGLSVRRFHDFGWTGWSVFLFLIPIVNFFIFLMFLFRRGDEANNKYGAPTPKSRSFMRLTFNTYIDPRE